MGSWERIRTLANIFSPDFTFAIFTQVVEIVLMKITRGSKKEGGGNDASLHSAMFDSARVRGVLRCYDAIDRVVRELSLSL